MENSEPTTSQNIPVSTIHVSAMAVDKTVTEILPVDQIHISRVPCSSRIDQSNSFRTEVLHPQDFSLVNLDLEQLQLQHVQTQQEGQQQGTEDVMDESEDSDGVNLVVKTTYWWCKDCNIKQKFGSGESIEDHLRHKHRINNKLEEAVEMEFSQSFVPDECSQERQAQDPSDMFTSVYTISSDSASIQDQGVDTLIVLEDSTALQVITKPTDDSGVFPSTSNNNTNANKVATSESTVQDFTNFSVPCPISSEKLAHNNVLSQLKPIPVIPALPVTPYLQSLSGSSPAKIEEKESDENCLYIQSPISNHEKPENLALSKSTTVSENAELKITESCRQLNKTAPESEQTKVTVASSMSLPRKSELSRVITRQQIHKVIAKSINCVQLQDCRVCLRRLSSKEIEQGVKKGNSSFVKSHPEKFVSSWSRKFIQSGNKKVLTSDSVAYSQNENKKNQLSSVQFQTKSADHSSCTDSESFNTSKSHVLSKLKRRSFSGRKIRKPARYLTEPDSEEENVENDVRESKADVMCASSEPNLKRRKAISSSRHSESEKQEVEKVANITLATSTRKVKEEKYTCHDCGRKFKFELKYKKHIQFYKGQTMQECDVCNVKLHNADLLNVHIYHVHKTQESTSCFTCGKVLGSKRNLRNHLLTHPNTEGQTVANLIKDSCAVHQCRICDDIVVVGEGRVEKHYTLHEKPNVYTCQRCKQTFQQKGELYDHLKLHGNMDEVIQRHADQKQSMEKSLIVTDQNCLSKNQLSVNQSQDEKLDVTSLEIKPNEKQIAESVQQIIKFEESPSENTDKITVTFIANDLDKAGAEVQLAGAEAQLAGAESQLAGAEVQLAGAEVQLAGVEVQLAQPSSSLHNCELCKRQFNSKKLLYQHLKIHGKAKSTSPGSAVNEDNMLALTEQETVLQPIDLSDGVPFGIPCSLVNLDSLRGVEDHVMRSFTTTPEGLVVPSKMHYSCALCEKEFETENMARRHTRRFGKQQTVVQCNHCPCKFHNLDLLNVHYTYVHQPEGAATCLTCNMDFSNKGDFIFHLGNTPTAHPLSFKTGLKTFLQDVCGTVTCPTCNKRMWNYPMNIANHTKMHKSFTCPICQQGYPYKYALLIHLQLHSHSVNHNVLNDLSEQDLEQSEIADLIEKIHRTVIEVESSGFVENEVGKKFCCPLCDAEVTHLRKNIHKHLDLHARKILHGTRKGRYFCPDCGEDLLVNDMNIVNHMTLHGHSGTQFFCVFCAYEFSSFEEFKEHEVKKHWLNSYFEKSMCEICGKELVNRQELREHVKLHEERQGLFACPRCKQTFRFESKLQKHLAKHDSGQDSYACQFCGKLYMTKLSLHRHEQVDHRGIKDFRHKCKQCDAQFINATHLRDHVTNKHTSKASYTCPECGMGFKHLSTFVRHKRVTHDGDTPYICQECGAKFPEKTGLQRHMIIHTGIDPFQCPVCQKSFSWERTMHEHYDFMHRGIVKHVCDKCGSKFPRKRNLLRHMTTCRMSSLQNN